MSVTIEVSELHVKVAKLEKDLSYAQLQKDAAVASTQTLIQVVTNLTTARELAVTPSTSSERTYATNQCIELEELKKKHEENQQKIKQLKEQLAISEKLRKNIQEIARRRLQAFDGVYAGVNANEWRCSPECSSDDESEADFQRSGRAKRPRNTSFDQDSYPKDSYSELRRGRSLIRKDDSHKYSSYVDSNLESLESSYEPSRSGGTSAQHNLAYTEDLAQPVPQFGSLPNSVHTKEFKVRDISVSATESSYTDVSTPDIKVQEAAALEAEQKALKKAEDERLLKIKIEKLRQLKLYRASVEKHKHSKQSQASDPNVTDESDKATAIQPSSSTEVSPKAIDEKVVSLGMIMKGHPFTEATISATTSVHNQIIDNKKILKNAYQVPAPSLVKRKQEEMLDQEESNGHQYKRHQIERPQCRQVVELNYSDEEDTIVDSPTGGMIYRDPDEIDLNLIDDDQKSTSTAEPESPIIEHKPWVPLSDALKAIDTLPCDWENSDNEDDIDVSPTTLELKPSANSSDENDDQAKAMKEKIAKLLSSWDDGEPMTPLQQFKVITEEPTIFNTGFDMSSMKFSGVDYNKDENGEYPVNPGGFQMLHGRDDKFSMYSLPNTQLWGRYEDRHEALRIHQQDEWIICDFFKYGLFYVPSPAESQNVFRTVHLGNLPKETTIGDLMARVRGGMIVSAQILDTMKLLGSKSALVVFMDADDAAEYVRFSMEHPISFGKNTALATLVGTPTWPIRAGLLNSIENLSHTRSLQIPGYPDHIPDKVLIAEITSKKTLTGLISDGVRAAAMEEPYLDKNTGIMTLNFASVELAGSAYGILKCMRVFRGLNPVFMEDPCAGDLEELLEPPPMAYERKIEGSEPTVLQKFQDSFYKAKHHAFSTASTMPDTPHFGFDLASILAGTKSSAASEAKESSVQKTALDNSIYAPKSEDEVSKNKTYPMLITSSAYKGTSFSTYIPLSRNT